MTYRSTSAFDLPFACDIRLEQGNGSSSSGSGSSTSYGGSSGFDDPLRATLTVRLRARFPRDRRASGLEVTVPMPSAARVSRASAEVSGSLGSADRTSSSSRTRGSLLRGGGGGGGQSQQQQQQSNALPAAAVGACEWDEAGRRLVWRCSGVPGGAVLELRARISLSSPYSPSLRSCVGPVCLRFTVPMVSATKLAVRYLHIGGGSGGSGSGGGGGGSGSLLSGGGGNSSGGGPGGSSPHRWVRYVTTSDSYVFRLA